MHSLLWPLLLTTLCPILNEHLHEACVMVWDALVWGQPAFSEDGQIVHILAFEGHIASVDVVVVAESQSHVQLLVTP